MTTATRPRWPAIVVGLLIAAGLVALDRWAGGQNILITGVVAAPFVTALVGGPRETVVVSLAAVALVAASPAWNESPRASDYALRLAIVGASGAVATIASRGRVRDHLGRRRFALLAAAAEVADGRAGLEETVERLTGLIVPEMADACVVDVVRSGRMERLSVRASGPRAETVADALRRRGPAGADGRLAPGRAADARAARLVERADGAALRAAARDEADLALLRSLELTSWIVVPLRARGRDIGVLTVLLTEDSRRRYLREDLRFAQVFASRAALALDNTGLFAELETAEARLTAALGGLAEAVTIQSASGDLVYVNEAAVRALGFATAEELLATPAQAIAARFESFLEDGSPLRLDDLPGRRVLAGERPEPLLVRSIERRTGEERWRLTKATAVLDRRGRPVMAVNVIEDVTDAKRSELEQRLLAAAGEALSSSLEYERTLQAVAELVVPRLADGCAISLPDRRGSLRQVAVAHLDPRKTALARTLDERYPVQADEDAGVALAVREGRSLMARAGDPTVATPARDTEHRELLDGIGARDVIIVPLTAAGRTLGALTLVNGESARRFTRLDLELAEALAGRMATAVENARLYGERSEIAAMLERGLRPPELPSLPGWSTATLYRPAGEFNQVGGDFYDAFPAPGGLMAVIGDVVGQGAEAATITSMARFTLRTACQLTGDPAVAARQLNATLLDRPELSLCTAICARFTPRADGGAEALIACCGHPLPLLLRDGEVRAVARPGPILGAFQREDWPTASLRMRPGDTLVFYTDGVTEAAGRGERFGEERLLRCLVEGPADPEGLVAHLAAALDVFQLPGQRDDTAVLAMRLTVAPFPVVHPPAGVGGGGADSR